MRTNPTPPDTIEHQPKQPLSFAKYFWLCAAIVAVPVLVMFDFLSFLGAGLLIGLIAVLIGGGIVALVARRMGKPVWVTLLWAALAGVVLAAPITWFFDLGLRLAEGRGDLPPLLPTMALWAAPLPLAWVMGALIARPKEQASRQKQTNQLSES